MFGQLAVAPPVAQTMFIVSGAAAPPVTETGQLKQLDVECKKVITDFTNICTMIKARDAVSIMHLIVVGFLQQYRSKQRLLTCKPLMI